MALTVGEGIALGVGAVVLAVGGYAFISTRNEDAAQQTANAQLQAQLLAQQLARPQVQSGSNAVDTGLNIFNAVGGPALLGKLLDNISN